MAGVLFIICIPTFEEENRLIGKKLTKPESDNKKVFNTPIKKQEYGTFPDREGHLRHARSTENIVVDVEQSESTDGRSPSAPSTSTTSSRSPIMKKSNTESNLKSYVKSALNADEGDGLRKSWDGLKGIMSSAGKLNSKLNLGTASTTTAANKKETVKSELSIPEDSCMVDVIKEMLLVMRIENAVWTEGNSHQKWQIIFSVDAGPRSDNIVQILNEWGIGDRAGSFVSILPCTLYKNADKNSESEEKSLNDLEQKETGWERFMSSVTARLNVAQIVEDVRGSAEITFDFISLLIVASLVAFFGLVENNSLFLAASMLISPLMGPIIAATFGTVIKDRKLQLFGVANELLGIALVTLVGFLSGLIVCLVDDKFSTGNGLTDEMLNRSLLRSVVIGIFVAIPSGIAVAIGILGDNFGSLAGVAISASLLPPAVNTGLMFSFAVIYKAFESDDERFNTLINSNKYSDHQSIELAVMGAISMCVTLTNVICIYLMGVMFFKIKEVVPALPENHRQFWRHDIKIAREYNKNHFEDNESLRRTLEDEIAGYETKNHNVRAEIFRRLSKQISHQNTWSPTSGYFTYHHREFNRKPLQDLFDHHYPNPGGYLNQMAQPRNRFNDYLYLPSGAVSSSVKMARKKNFNFLDRIHERANVSQSSQESLNSASGLDATPRTNNNSKRQKFLVIPVDDQNGDNSQA